jgi:hypothetical protein
MSRNLDSKVLAEFVRRAGDRLTGEWLLVGGTLLPALGIDVRSTVDIDLLGLGKNEASQTLELMELAQSLGLSAEAVNQTAAFFLKKIKYDAPDLIILHKGKSATILRPSVSLYFKLKLARFTETDQTDCEHYYRFCTQVGDPIDPSELEDVLKKEERASGSREKRDRIRVLRKFITEL